MTDKKDGGTHGEEPGFAILQNRKADWPSPDVRREALVALERQENLPACAGMRALFVCHCERSAAIQNVAASIGLPRRSAPRNDEKRMNGGTCGEESGFAILQNRKADWPSPTVRREALVALERQENLPACACCIELDTGFRRYDGSINGGTSGEEPGFAIQQNRKADWPSRTVSREAARRLSAKQKLPAFGGNKQFPYSAFMRGGIFFRYTVVTGRI